MSRSLRIEFSGAVYHIASRGNKKNRIFEDGRDKEAFLKIVGSVVERYNFIYHAYCLMDNHYHLLIETPEGNLSLGMRQLNGVYAQKYNRVYNTVGHLLQGRYKAILVEKESYLLELCRYIVLNPVRAGMVKYPWEYKWSSCAATLGRVKPPEFLTVDWILLQFAEKRKEAERAYGKFVLSEIGNESPWKDLKGRVILCNTGFAEKLENYLEKKKRLNEIPRIQRFAARKELKEIFKGVEEKSRRNRQIYTAHIKYGYTLKEIADYLEIHYSTVSKILKKLLKKESEEWINSRFKT